MYIEKGQIVEDGTHEELIKMQGAYYNMMKGGHLENDELIQTNEADNENSANEKLVEKIMFTESQLHSLDKTNGN